MKRALNFIDCLSEWVGKAASFLILGIIGIMVSEVVGRYVFNRPLVWSYESATFLFGAFNIFGGAYTLLYKGHVNVDVLHSLWSQKTRAIIDLITSTVFFCFCGVLLWKGTQMAWSSLKILEYSTVSTWEPPLYPIKMSIPIAVFLLLLQGLAKFARDFITAITGSEIE